MAAAKMCLEQSTGHEKGPKVHVKHKDSGSETQDKRDSGNHSLQDSNAYVSFGPLPGWACKAKTI